MVLHTDTELYYIVTIVAFLAVSNQFCRVTVRSMNNLFVPERCDNTEIYDKRTNFQLNLRRTSSYRLLMLLARSPMLSLLCTGVGREDTSFSPFLQFLAERGGGDLAAVIFNSHIVVVCSLVPTSTQQRFSS